MYVYGFHRNDFCIFFNVNVGFSGRTERLYKSYYLVISSCGASDRESALCEIISAVSDEDAIQVLIFRLHYFWRPLAKDFFLFQLFPSFLHPNHSCQWSVMPACTVLRCWYTINARSPIIE